MVSLFPLSSTLINLLHPNPSPSNKTAEVVPRRNDKSCKCTVQRAVTALARDLGQLDFCVFVGKQPCETGFSLPGFFFFFWGGGRVDEMYIYIYIIDYINQLVYKHNVYNPFRDVAVVLR